MSSDFSSCLHSFGLLIFASELIWTHCRTLTYTNSTSHRIIAMLGLRTLRTAPIRQFKPHAQLGAKRWTSGVGEHGLSGAADNAFNRERAAVKDHAAATSGTWWILSDSGR